MKTLKCTRCKVAVNVKDDYDFKTCPNCRVKLQAYAIERKEAKKLDKQSQKDIKGLGMVKTQLSPMLWNFSIYSKNFERKFKRKASYEDDYLKELTHAKLELAHNASKQESAKVKAKFQKYEPIISFNDLKGKECKTFRLCKLAEKFKFKVNYEIDLEHVKSCEDCQDWIFNFNSGVLFDDLPTEIDKVELAEEKAFGKVIDDDLDSLRKNDSLNEFIKSGKSQPMKPQYQNSNEPEHVDFWGRKEGTENPLDKFSHQQNIKAMFGERAE